MWLLGGVLFLGNVTGLATTLPQGGFATTSVGAFLEAVGVSFLRAPPARGWLRRRTSLMIVIPSLLLFSLMLLGAALVFAESFEQATTAFRWTGSTLFLLLSTVMVSALFREVVLRLDKPISQRRRDGAHDASSGRTTGRDEAASRWRFTPLWKEELVCASPDGERLVLEMMMEPHVYFPTEEAWARQAPEWAKDRRAELLSELEEWCAAYGVLLTVDERALVGSG